MNTHNHHKIIQKLADSIKLDPQEKKMLIKASDYTDDFVKIGISSIVNSLIKVPSNLHGALSELKKSLTQTRYFFYHFYYDIDCSNDTIVLRRNNYDNMENSDQSCFKQSMDNCEYDEIEFSIKPGDYDYMAILSGITDSPINYKKFYNIINDRETIRKSYFENYVKKCGFIDKIKAKKLDSSNQSDCVAFLHAMGSYGEAREKSMEVFKDHVVNCLAEYLFLQNPNEAMIMLGIAFHSIMDSFTPSHTGFKNYVQQDMALHAQGDVVPFIGDPIYFDPGQFIRDGIASNGATMAAALVKGYNSDDYINNTEYKMLKVYIDSYLVANHKTAELKRKCPSSLYALNIDFFVNPYYNYNIDAFQYTYCALNVLNKIYTNLKEEKKKSKNYENYKAAKKKLENLFISSWQKDYNRIQNYKASHHLLYVNAKTDKSDVVDFKDVVDYVSDLNKAIRHPVAYAREKLKDYVSNFLLDKVDALSNTIDVLMGEIDSERNQEIQEKKDSIREKCGKVIDNAHEIIDTADQIMEEVDQRVNAIKQDVDNVLQTATVVCDTIKDSATGVKQAAEYILSNIDEYATALSNAVNSTIGVASNMVTQVQQTVTNYAQTAFTTAMNTVDKFSAVANSTCENVKGAAAKVIGITDMAQEKLGKYLPSSWFDKVRGVANSISDTMNDVQAEVNQATDVATNAITNVRDKVQQEANTIASEAQQMLSNVQQKATTLITTARQEAESMLQNATGVCDQLIEQADAIKAMVNEMQVTADKYKGIYDSLKQQVSDYLTKADDFLNSAEATLGKGNEGRVIVN